MAQIKHCGFCRVCNKPVIRDWGSVNPQYHCIGCGIVTNYAGRHPKVDSKTVLCAINSVFNATGEKKIRTEVLMDTVRMIVGYTPTIEYSCVRKAGYKQVGSWIVKEK